jgi:hypothetical protein
MINTSREEKKWKSAFFFEKYTFSLKSAVFFSYISYKGLFTYKSVI